MMATPPPKSSWNPRAPSPDALLMMLGPTGNQIRVTSANAASKRRTSSGAWPRLRSLRKCAPASTQRPAQQADREDHDPEHREEPADVGRHPCHAAEAQQRRDEGDHEERHGPVQHRSILLCSDRATVMPAQAPAVSTDFVLFDCRLENLHLRVVERACPVERDGSMKSGPRLRSPDPPFLPAACVARRGW